MISFEEALCGHYTNKAQATSDPQKWPWVNIEWTEIKKGKILECNLGMSMKVLINLINISEQR